MPPKQTSEQIDVRLDELEALIKSNAASIATVDADSMLAVLSKRQKQCPEADTFRKWLHRTESRMPLLQQQRVIAIFELITSSSQQQEQKQEQHKQHQERSRAEKASSASASASVAASSAHATGAPLESATSARSKRSTPSLGEKPSKKQEHEQMQEQDAGAEKSDCAAESSAAPAKKAAKKAPLLEIFARQKRTHAETSATDTGESPASPATMVSSKVALKIRVDALRKELEGKGANLLEFEVRDLTHVVTVLVHLHDCKHVFLQA